MRGPIFLIGCMGSGKTSVGRLLARKARMDFIDLDESIEDEIGMSISNFFNIHGEKRFREIESRMFKDVALRDDVIISCGGGIVLNKNNMSILRSRGMVILLTADLNTLAERVGNDGSRPLLCTDDKAGRMKQILKDREELYLYASDVVIDTTGLTVEQVVGTILEKELI
ncbi:MAG: shikimate kinase [Candidatus Methanofastidiosa archaeon]|nr:shikimate kinase [Candidatus Methanofastidiosa archaeon]